VSVVRSISTDQGEILDWILALHVPEGRFDCDATYGNGMFWRGRAEPVFKFDLSDPAQRAQACHYTNIQPLWRSDNRRKGAKCL